jgi:general secretion pathway protein D
MFLHASKIARRLTSWQTSRAWECRRVRGRSPGMRRTFVALAAAVGATLAAPAGRVWADDRLLEQAAERPARRPDELVTLSLENAELPDLVRTMSEMTGKRFVLGVVPKSFQATVVAPQKVTVAEAYQAFLSLLAANHLTVVPRGRFLKIVEAQDAVHEAPVHSSRDGGVLPEERYVTYVHRVAHVSAEEVANGVLSKLASHDGAIVPYGNVLVLTDTGANVQRMMRVLDELDVAQAEDKVWFEPLQYVPSVDVKKELEELVDLRGAEKDKDRKAPAASAARVTKVVALDRPNALLVVGSQAGYERLLELLRAIDVATPSEGQMHVVMLQHADAKKLVAPINEAVSAGGGAGPGAAGGAGAGANAARVLEAPVKVSAEETNNALIVTASAHDFAAVREVIRRLDQPRRQVYIEAVVMDLTVKRDTVLESALHGMGTPSSDGSVVYGGSNPLKSILLPTDATSLQGLVLGVRGPSIPVPGFLQSTLGTTSIPGLGFFLDAYAVSNDADILSTPHILATDNTPAEIHVQLNTSLQKNVPSYGAPSTGGAGGSGAASAASAFALYSAPAAANYGKIGPKIKVTPHIDESEEVRLDVEETISDLTGDPPQGSLGTVDFTERGATTTLTVKDGRTVVIGGLVRDKVTHYATKVPLLGDIPVLGALFRSTKDSVEKTNLVLVLTPHIIRNEDDMREIFDKRMQERQEFVDHYFAFRDGPPLGFDPKHGHGLLAELRVSHAEAAERRRLDAPPPETTLAHHEPRPAMDLPSSVASAPAATGVASQQPPALHVAPPARTVNHTEK